MATATAVYLGDLRTQCTHTASGSTIQTDAPVDNQGKGQAFSPTDLCAMSLGSCALTIMGIYAQKHSLNIQGATMEVTKTMSADPRRIAKIQVIFTIPEGSLSEEHKKNMQHEAHNCPVCFSLHPETEKEFIFTWVK